MSEWIEKEEVLKQIDCWFTTGEYKYSNATHYLNKRISSIKPKEADVQPVKQGRWETWGYIFHGILWKRCSVCGKTADISYQALLDGKIEMATPIICGCCSARMDGDNNG